MIVLFGLSLSLLVGVFLLVQESPNVKSPNQTLTAKPEEQEQVKDQYQARPQEKPNTIIGKYHFEKVIEKNPKNLRARSQLAEIQFIKGDYKKSYEQLMIILESSKQPSAWENYSEEEGYALALSLYEQNYKRDEIIKNLENNLNTNPHAHRILAEIYRKQQNGSRAEELLEDGIARFPQNPSLYRDLAMIKFEKKNFKEADELASQWNESSTDDEEKDLSFDLRYQAFLGAEIEFAENREQEIDELLKNWKHSIPSSKLLQQRQQHYQAYRSRP